MYIFFLQQIYFNNTRIPYIPLKAEITMLRLHLISRYQGVVLVVAQGSVNGRLLVIEATQCSGSDR